MGRSEYQPFDELATINIEISGSVNILCIAPPGSALTDACWQIKKVTRTQDSNFAGYPYERTQWAINPATGKAEATPILIAANATTYSFI